MCVVFLRLNNFQQPRVKFQKKNNSQKKIKKKPFKKIVIKTDAKFKKKLILKLNKKNKNLKIIFQKYLSDQHFNFFFF